MRLVSCGIVEASPRSSLAAVPWYTIAVVCCGSTVGAARAKDGPAVASGDNLGEYRAVDPDHPHDAKTVHEEETWRRGEPKDALAAVS